MTGPLLQKDGHCDTLKQWSATGGNNIWPAYFRNIFRNNIQNKTLIFSGNDYVLYSMLKMSNVSLNIILREIIVTVKATIDILPPCPLFFTSHLPCFCCHIIQRQI